MNVIGTKIKILYLDSEVIILLLLKLNYFPKSPIPPDCWLLPKNDVPPVPKLLELEDPKSPVPCVPCPNNPPGFAALLNTPTI